MTTPETMRGRFEEKFTYHPYGVITKEGKVVRPEFIPFTKGAVLAFIESELATRDAHHKALRAKELEEIREKINETPHIVNFRDVESCRHYSTAIIALLDELIEKPTI
jgi:hypothetical protein